MRRGEAFEQECHGMHVVRSSGLIASVLRGLGGEKRECGSRDACGVGGTAGRGLGLQIMLLLPRMLSAAFLGFITVPNI